MGLMLSSTFVLPHRADADSDDAKLRIAAFYTLANQSLVPDVILSTKNLPRYQAPVVLIAQLGVDRAHQRKGLGSKTFITALQHAYSISANPNGIPSLGVVLDAVDQHALEFYLSFDFFLQFEGQPSRLFVPMETIGELLSLTESG